MKSNVGWKATISAPTVHAHGVRGTSSRRKRKIASTVHAAISALSSRISSSLARMSFEGESQYGITSSA